MLSYISYFKKVPAFSIAVLIICLFEITLHFLPNLHYFDGKGAFFTYYKRYIAEKGKEDFDIVMYGDSRSLSINGNPKDDNHKYSFYNFSLPAAGPWYFKFFLKKYLKYHNPPKLVIWAVDPQQFATKKTEAFHDNPALWNEFKHRLLNLFTIGETIEQYEGMELFFILKEYIPHSFLSVQHRQGFESIINSKATKVFNTPFLVKENRVVEKVVEQTYGQINLGNFFMVPNIREVAEKERDNQLASLNGSGEFNLDPLKKFLEYSKENNLKVVVLNIPRLKEFNESLYFRKVTPAIKGLTSEFSNAKYLEFSDQDFDLDLLSESIHYNEKGSNKVNEDFSKEILPKLYDYIEGKE
ncbi:MAG: DUF1574 family protein [Leptospiraceae bacterium]|nr:DUF1574 family protein [Leptospiraceae bacterium]